MRLKKVPLGLAAWGRSSVSGPALPEVFHCLHEVTQAWQPTQTFRSMTRANCRAGGWAGRGSGRAGGGGGGGGVWVVPPPIWRSVASPIICRSALAIGAHRGVASLANTLG